MPHRLSIRYSRRLPTPALECATSEVVGNGHDRIGSIHTMPQGRLPSFLDAISVITQLTLLINLFNQSMNIGFKTWTLGIEFS